MKEQNVEKIRIDFLAKMHKQQELKEKFEDDLYQKLVEKNHKAQDKDHKRTEAMMEAQRRHKQKINDIVKRTQEHDALKAEMDHKREQEFLMRQELNALNIMRKRRNVARLMRKMKFRREQLLERVNEDMSRTTLMEQQKADLMLVRQKNKISALRQKQELISVFGELKKNPKVLLEANEHEQELAEQKAKVRIATCRI